jgi:hydroxymethylpyrimidine pyrophosphatase-like HAD family hydrolase
MENIFLFIDLDDTLFQTHHKNPFANIQATFASDSDRNSYMTESQQLFFELFHQSKNVKIIPTTARNLEQYHNTFFSQKLHSETAILYFSGIIFDQNVEDKQWQKHIHTAFSQLKTSVKQIVTHTELILKDIPEFSVYNTDDYYMTVKANRHCPESVRESYFSRVRALKTEEYFIHENGIQLSLVPMFLDKCHAVNYLINKYKPELTLSMGDSLSDLPFMRKCDFMIIPKNSQIAKNRIFP